MFAMELDTWDPPTPSVYDFHNLIKKMGKNIALAPNPIFTFQFSTHLLLFEMGIVILYADKSRVLCPNSTRG